MLKPSQCVKSFGADCWFYKEETLEKVSIAEENLQC